MSVPRINTQAGDPPAAAGRPGPWGRPRLSALPRAAADGEARGGVDVDRHCRLDAPPRAADGRGGGPPPTAGFRVRRAGVRRAPLSGRARLDCATLLSPLCCPARRHAPCPRSSGRPLRVSPTILAPADWRNAWPPRTPRAPVRNGHPDPARALAAGAGRVVPVCSFANSSGVARFRPPSATPVVVVLPSYSPPPPIRGVHPPR